MTTLASDPHVDTEKVTVRFLPYDASIEVDQGENLLRAAVKAGVHVNASCGGAGVCGKCRVIVESGDVESRRSESISEEEYEKGVRLACQTRVLGDTTVSVTVDSQLDKRVLARRREDVAVGALTALPETAELNTDWTHDPPLTKLHIKLTPPTLQTNRSDLSRIVRCIKQRCRLDDVVVSAAMLQKLPEVARDDNWNLTATLYMPEANLSPGSWLASPHLRLPSLTNVEAGDTTKSHYALALDIGTTTVCAELIDLVSAETLAFASDYNAQIRFGDDVISRIVYSQRDSGLSELQGAVVSTINGLLEELSAASGVDRDLIALAVVSGNTLMTHLLFGLDPRYLREAPYTPAVNFMPPVPADSIGLQLGRQVSVHAFPAVSSYVGGDIVSGVMAAGIYLDEALTLYVDIGTNGEVAVGNCDFLMTASCSAGPAFEGGGVRNGMRAGPGAIEQFAINPATCDPMLLTVGMEKPRGICGSGLISIVAELLTSCIIGQNGKFHAELPTDRIRESADGHEFVLAWADQTETGSDIVVTEADIDNLIRAKGAMYAGALTLLESADLTFEDVDRVMVAGAFGSFLNVEKAITIGLFPEIPPDRFVFIGNGSLMGSRLLCLSKKMLREANRVSKMMTNIELSESHDFMDKFMASLFLPHTDPHRFPRVTEKLASCQLPS